MHQIHIIKWMLMSQGTYDEAIIAISTFCCCPLFFYEVLKPQKPPFWDIARLFLSTPYKFQR